MSDPENLARIERIVESVVTQLQNGENVDFENILQSNPDLEPLLRQRLDLVRNVFAAAGSADTGQLNSDFNPQKNHITRLAGGTPTMLRSVECSQCGAKLETQEGSLDDVTCINCGNVIPLPDAQTRTLQPVNFEVGRFRLLDCVGSGGFGVVYKARDLELDRYVAVKLPKAGYFQSHEQLERFNREARHAAKLSHPGIVPVYEVGQQEDNAYIVSKFIDGLTLSDLIAKKRLDYEKTASIVKAIAEAVAFAHTNKVIHRDLKPNNILLDKNRNPFVADFGLSRAVEGDETITVEGAVLGTPAFMSPEQVVGDQTKISYPSDIYSLGVILYRMLTGELPFRGGRRAILHQVLHVEPLTPRKLDESIPLDLETIANKAMAKEPDRRYSSADEMAKDLQRFLAGEPIAARPVSQVEKAWLWCRRKPVVASLTCALALMLAASSVGGAIWGYRESVNRKKLQIALEGESEERIRADAAALESQNRLGRLYTMTGIRELAEGNHLQALPWLTEAWGMDRGRSERDAIHRLRLGMTLKHSPRLIAATGRESMVRDADFSPDGQSVACGFEDGYVLVFDVASGNPILKVDSEASGAVNRLAFCHEGRRLAVARQNKLVQLWNLETGQQLGADLRHPVPVFSIEFSPDNEKLLTRSRSGPVYLWNLTTSEVIAKFDHGEEHPVDRSKFVASGEMVLSTVRFSNRLYRWSLEDASQPSLVYEAAFNGEPSKIWDFEIDHDRGLVVAFCNDGTIAWNLDGESDEPEFVLPHRPSAVTASFLDEHVLLTILEDGEIQFWDPTTGKQVEESILTGDGVYRAKLSPDKKLVGIASQGNDGFIWRLNPPGLVCANLSHSKNIKGIEFSPGGRYVLTYSNDGLVKIWDIKIGHLTLPRVQHSDDVRSVIAEVDLSDDARLMAVSCRDHFVYLRSAMDGRLVGQPLEHPHAIIRADFSPDGTRLATACQDGQVRVWDTKTCQQIQLAEMKHDRPAVRIVFSPDGKWVISGDTRGLIHVWAAQTGLPSFELTHDNHVISFSFSPDGKMLATTGADGTAKVWDMSSQRLAFPPLVHDMPPPVMTCRFSPDGSRLITASQDGSSIIWDARTGEKLSLPLRHNASVWDARFHPIEDTVLTASNDGNVYIWDDLDKPRWKVNVKAFGADFDNTQTPFGMNGKFFMTASHRPVSKIRDRRRMVGAVQLWGTETGDLISPLLPHYDEFTDARLSPDGQRIIASDRSGVLQFWPLTRETRPLEEVREIAEVLSGYRIDPESGIVALSAQQLVEKWQALREREVAEFRQRNYQPEDHWQDEPVPVQ